MTRNEFAKVVANKMKHNYPHAGISNEDAKIWTMAVFDCLADTLINNEKVILLNFGTFETYTTKPRKRGDINSNSTVVEPSKVRLKFTTATNLKKRISALPVE